MCIVSIVALWETALDGVLEQARQLIHLVLGKIERVGLWARGRLGNLCTVTGYGQVRWLV
jgi:hypothetical protein